MAANLDRVHPNVAEYFHGYPLERLWYLLFDYNRRFLGPAGFDRPSPDDLQKKGEQLENEHETGYLLGMFSGFNYVLETIDTPLSLEYLLNLHNKAMSEKIKGKFKGKYRDPLNDREGTGNITVGLSAEGLRRNVTLAGLAELRKKIREGDNYFRIAFMGDLYNHHDMLLNHQDIQKVNSIYSPAEQSEIAPQFERWLNELKKDDIPDEKLYKQIKANEEAIVVIRFACSQAEIFNRLDTIIRTFHMHMATPGISEDEQIRAIAICVHEILLTHPFSDGNGRTIALLLNKLLLQYNLSPTILENPTIIDAFSIDELCIAIKKGQSVFNAQKIRTRSVDSIFREAEDSLSADPVAPKTEDSVMYLKNNPYVAALLVHAATDPIFIWDEINIGDRQRAVDFFVSDLCANSPMLNARQVEQKEEDINNKVTMALYKRGTFQFFSNGNMFSRVAHSISHGKFGEATHMVFDSNRYGIDFGQLESGNHEQDLHSSRGPLPRH